MLALAEVTHGELASSWLSAPGVGELVLVVAGLLAGIVNSMAGGGSFLTLPLLMALGLPASVANGTMRVAIIPQSLGSMAAFHRREVRPYRLGARLIAPMGAGALAGAYLATRLDDQLFRPIVGVIFVGWAISLLFRPDRFIHPAGGTREPGLRTYLYAAGVGLYGGFLQAGVGLPLLALMVAHLGRDAVEGNAAKAFVTLAYTCVVLPVFAFAEQVAWTPALALALGSTTGAWLGARWQLRAGAPVVRWFVLVTVAASGVIMVWSSIDALGR